MTTLRGRASTFGRDPKTGYVDPGDNGQNASGLPQSTPGIAVFSRSTLGGYWQVKAPNGKSMVVRQVDIGPSPGTGRKIDVNSPLARLLGYPQGNRFPTDQGAWKATYIGKKQPAGAGSIAGGKTPSKQRSVPSPVDGAPVSVDEQARKLAILSAFLNKRNPNNTLTRLGVLG